MFVFLTDAKGLPFNKFYSLHTVAKYIHKHGSSSRDPQRTLWALTPTDNQEATSRVFKKISFATWPRLAEMSQWVGKPCMVAASGKRTHSRLRLWGTESSREAGWTMKVKTAYYPPGGKRVEWFVHSDPFKSAGFQLRLVEPPLKSSPVHPGCFNALLHSD